MNYKNTGVTSFTKGRLTNKLRIGLLAAAGTLLILPSLSASILAPGSTVAPDVFTNGANLVLLASITQTVNPVPGSSFNATYTEWVYRDNSGTGLCSACLDFFISLSNAGPGVIEDITTSLAPGFTGFNVDVGYNTTGVVGGPAPPASGVTPTNVNRTGTGGPNDVGSVIDFHFPGAGEITSGHSSALLEIQTNALFFTTGTVSVQDGVSGFSVGFAPTATPEPATMALLGLGFLGLGTLKLRRGKKQASE